MNRMQRRTFKAKGFRPGNVPYKQTELANVIIANNMIYQVKERDSQGRPSELYETTYFRALWISWRFKIHSLKKFFTRAWSR